MDGSDCTDRDIVLFIIIQIVFTVVFFFLICGGRRDDCRDRETTFDFTGRASLVKERSERSRKARQREDRELKEVLKALQDGGRLSLVINPSEK